MKRIHLLGVLAVAIAASSCHREPTAPALFFHGLLQSDQDLYAATTTGSGSSAVAGFTLIARYVNRSNAPVYIERCLASDTQPRYGAQSAAADSVPAEPPDEIPGACSGNAPLAVAAGTVRTDTFTVAAPASLPANMRIYYDVSSCGNELGLCGAMLPDSERVSNTFQVRAAP